MKDSTRSNDLSFRGVAMVATAIGALAIGRVVIGRAELKSLEIQDLTVKRLHAAEVVVSDSLQLPEHKLIS